MADISQRLEAANPALSTALSMITLVVFGTKAALFPLYMWLPDSYPTAPAPVTALFAGLLTKVGVYSIFRTQTLMFDAESSLLLAVAGATMFFGVIGAVSQRDVKRILSFHIISQIGYMVMGLGLASAIGIAAGIAYVVNQIIVKTGLFLVAGEIEAENGDSGLGAGDGLMERRPGLAVAFAVLALSLAGVPPTAGFVLKYALIREAIGAGHVVVAVVAVFVSLLTLFSMLKIWSGIFWGEPAGSGPGARIGMRVVTVSVAALSLTLAVWANGFFELSSRAADELASANSYVMAVLER
jgi:multicomponent Na+:H+ antiporter subunit D